VLNGLHMISPRIAAPPGNADQPADDSDNGGDNDGSDNGGEGQQ
jgi:hypothetical protein